MKLGFKKQPTHTEGKNVKYIIRYTIVILALASGLAARAQIDSLLPGTNQVISLNGSLSGVTSIQGNGIITRVKFHSDEIINLARGRSPQATVPANEILVWVINTTVGGAVTINVFDTNTQSSLAVVALLADNYRGASTLDKGIVAFNFALQNVGDSTNALSAGFLTLVAKITFDGTGTGNVVKLSAETYAGVDLISDGQFLQVAITKGKLAGSRIATVIVP
jgi:hypothetical protein